MARKGNTSESLFGDEDLFDGLLDNIKKPLRSRGDHVGQVDKTSSTDAIFKNSAGEEKKDNLDFEDSDVSAADPNDILKTLEDLEDMDANLFQSEKKNSTKPPTMGGPKKDPAVSDANSGTNKSNSGEKKPPLPSTPNLKKSIFSDLDDPLFDPFDDLLPDETKSKAKPKPPPPEKPSAPSNADIQATSTPKKATLSFDKDDFMETLVFDNEKGNAKKKESPFWSKKESKNDPPQRPRTKIDDILEGISAQRPPPVEKMEIQEKNSTQKVDEDLTFGSYQPTLASTSEGRQSRRHSVRFPSEDFSASPEKRTKPTTSRHRNSADWLSFKNDDDLDYLPGDTKEAKVSTEPLKVSASSSPVLERRSSLTESQSTANRTVVQIDLGQAKAEVSKNQKKQEKEEDDWFAVTKKKMLSTKAQANTPEQENAVGQQGRSTVDLTSNHKDAPQAPRSIEDTHLSAKATNSAASPARVREERSEQVSLQSQPQTTPASLQQQVDRTADSSQVQQQQQQTALPAVMDGAAVLRLKDKERELGDYQALLGRITELEGKLKMVQLERDQSQLLLENLQQRQKQDVEFIENAHKVRVKLLEEAAAQRETRSRLECEDLIERMAALTQSAEQERSETQAQYQRKVAQIQQERDREVERLRDLQRQSILEMKKDHEEQIQRLKRLKDEEIDAVTSATSQTRSLTGVIEQMEQFSSRLEDLSSRVESAHEHSAHGLEQGTRHREEQLRVLQERLAQQQKATAEERAHLKEVISRMDAQINEQQRQLEKERWKVTSEQAKAESLQRSLEEERRVLNMQSTMEREELERAKSSLLEEQKSVMQHCAEERRKLAAEWAHFHDQEKRRHERTEREVSSLLEKREGSVISLAQEQAELKLRTAEVRQKEMTLTHEQETLDRLRDELEREKERIKSTALKLEARTHEVESLSKLAANKYEEGEQALRRAKQMEAEHEVRLRSIHSQLENLRTQEQRILKERMQLNYLQSKERPPQLYSTSGIKEIVPPVLPAAGFPKAELAAQNIIPSSTTNYQSMAREACLALWKYTAEKENDFLQDEQIFLESLKKKSYRFNKS